jgi:hypothetical protein
MDRLTASQQKFARKKNAVLSVERNFVPGQSVFMYRVKASSTDRWLVDSSGVAIEYICFKRFASSG